MLPSLPRVSKNRDYHSCCCLCSHRQMLKQWFILLLPRITAMPNHTMSAYLLLSACLPEQTKNQAHKHQRQPSKVSATHTVSGQGTVEECGIVT